MSGLCAPADVLFDVHPHVQWRILLLEACRKFREGATQGSQSGIMMFVNKGRCVDGTPQDTVESMGIRDGDIVYTEFLNIEPSPRAMHVARRLNFDV